MEIRTLRITNYRGVTSLKLDLHKRLNVFYGVNGSGKSTMLDAVAVMLSWVVSRLRFARSSGRPIIEPEISNGKSFSTIEIECNKGDLPIRWNLTKNRKGHFANDDRSDFANLNEFIKILLLDILHKGQKVNLPLFSYYPVNRAVLDIPLRIREKHSFNIFTAYDNALTGGTNFRTFFEWFREREDLENENRRYIDYLLKPEGFQFPDSQLEAVRRALLSFLPDFKNLTVRRNPLRMEVEKNGKRLTVNQLSDGEKCLIAMIGDLARRMSIANPARENPLEGEGIILIDEIDLHLHPKWQRMIIPKLLEVFPNAQFIISTHSPHVITQVQPESLFLLKQTDSGMVAEQPTESYGKSVERILEDLMGLETTRPDEVSVKLHDIYSSIDQNHIEEARRSIAVMKEEIGEDPELMKAEILIRRKEIIGK